MRPKGALPRLGLIVSQANGGIPASGTKTKRISPKGDVFLYGNI